MPNHKRAPAKDNRNFMSVMKKYPFLFLILSIAIVAIMSTFIYRFFEQQKTLNELSSVSKDLRVIYDKILTSQAGNVSSSNFSNECSESSVEVGRGLITCGTSGTIVIKQSMDIDKSGKTLDDAVAGSPLDSGDKARVYIGKYDSGSTIKFRSMYRGISCDGGYGQSSMTRQWSFSVTCSKSVPDFLPGYIVAE